jgi:hypothetical protein
MSAQGWQETLAIHRAVGTLFNTYTAAKSVINPDALIQLPPNYFKPEKAIRIFVAGAISNIVTTPGLMNFQVKLGTLAAPVTVFDTGNIQLNATAHVLLPFWIDLVMTCRAAGSGAAANFIGLANVAGIMFTRTAGQIDDVQGMQTILAPQIAPAVGGGFDSTIANLLDFWAGFTISNAGNGIQIHQYKVASLN